MHHKVIGTFENGRIISHTDPTEAYRLICEYNKPLALFRVDQTTLDLRTGQVSFEDVYMPDFFLEEPTCPTTDRRLVYYRTMEQKAGGDPVMVSYTIGYEGISNGNLVRRTITMENLDV